MSDGELGLDEVRLDDISTAEPSSQAVAPPYRLEPPESIDASIVYKLYRGTTGEVEAQSRRIWVEFPALQLCWAAFDRPPQPQHRLSLLDLACCSCGPANPQATDGFSELLRMEIWGDGDGSCRPRGKSDDGPGMCRTGQAPSAQSTALSAVADAGATELVQVQNGGSLPSEKLRVARMPLLSVEANSLAIKEFSVALQKLLASRDSEGASKLEFIQRSLFQYLWRHQGVQLAANSEQALYEAQAVLAFNLDPKEGVKYLKGKLGKVTDQEVGEWLAQMSTLNGGLDPTLLGNYFSRMDAIEVYKAFVCCMDFQGLDLVAALRKLFDTFKPGGEGQVISRIIELWADRYFDTAVPKTDYAAADSVFSTAFSVIMLNTGLHVASKKATKKGPVDMGAMTPEEFVKNTRRVVGENEVPEEALLSFYQAVKEAEISMQPMPRVAFSRLPVQPDIEGWLMVLALQRLYLFSDSSDVDPADACDLKDASAHAVLEDASAKDRFYNTLHGRQNKCMCFVRNGRDGDLLDEDFESRAFEVSRKAEKGSTWLKKLGKASSRLSLVAESTDLMEKWVSLITSGPY
eukprot:TRINITY_DN16488_c0_g1_i2.p1 TRINITY_DN16488_c0_g1~~TRINITY_DN16488_c0_g1_i2.p1  ORF type:complete len:576 (+),score=123.26 TRINITY_DN16488_c0_g1_i2:159-1886(+)